MKEKKNFLYASACVAALLCGGAASPALADCGSGGQCSVSDGTTQNLTGGNYEMIGTAPAQLALYAENASVIIGESLTLSQSLSTGSDDFIIQARNGGTINLTNSQIGFSSTSAAPRSGFFVEGTQSQSSQITFDGDSISVRERVAHVGANGQLSLLNGVVVEATQGKTNGSDNVFQVEQDGQLTIKGGFIKTGTTATLGRFASVVYAKDNADVVLEGVDITANLAPAGNRHNALWLEGSARANVTGGTITGSGLDFVAVASDANAQVNLKGTDISFNNAVAVALQASGSSLLEDGTSPRTAILFEDGKITAQGNGSVAVEASEDARVTINNGDITAITGAALYAGDNAAITLTNSTIQSDLIAMLPAVVLGNNAIINFNNVAMTAGNVGVMFGEAPGNANNASFNMTGGSINVAGLAVADQSAADNIFRVSNGSVAGNQLVGAYRDEDISLGSKLSFIADNATLSGVARVDEVSNLAMDLRNGTKWTIRYGAGYGGDEPNRSRVSTLTLGNGSSVIFGSPLSGVEYQTLQVGYGMPGQAAVYNGWMTDLEHFYLS